MTAARVVASSRREPPRCATSHDGTFIYNWKTPKHPGRCYQLTVTTNDGSQLAALFKVK